MTNPIQISNVGGGPTGCPTCGAEDVSVATDGRGRPPTKQNPRGKAERFMGYDCRACGQKLRFSILEPS
jgi:transcription elongation factor Elf1